MQASDDTLAGRIAALCDVFVEVAVRSAPYWRIFREAAAVDQEIAADWITVTQRRRATLAVAAKALPKPGRRPGVSERALRDTLSPCSARICTS